MSTVTDLESYQQFALQQQAEERAWSAEQAQKQMDFQERLSSSAHQREVADLQAAGLNPVLSVNSGASVPNGSMASTDDSASRNVGNILQQVLQSQSAQSVASMYTAATIYAAQIAAEASKYGADMAYQKSQDFPDTWAGLVSRGVKDAQRGLKGKVELAKQLFDTKSDYYAKGGRSDFSKWIAKHYGYRFGQDWNSAEFDKYFDLWQKSPALLRLALFKIGGKYKD